MSSDDKEQYSTSDALRDLGKNEEKNRKASKKIASTINRLLSLASSSQSQNQE